MKKLLFLCLPLALLYACGEKAHKTELIFDKTADGLHITSAKDTFNAFKSQYYVSAMIKNDTKEVSSTFLVTAKYVDGAGDIVAESTAGAGRAIAPGDSLLIENTYSFSSNKDVPYKVKLSVKDILK
ncbi:MAG: hypothetical protein V4592_03950 [Bacteroidota bacterium]